MRNARSGDQRAEDLGGVEVGVERDGDLRHVGAVHVRSRQLVGERRAVPGFRYGTAEVAMQCRAPADASRRV